MLYSCPCPSNNESVTLYQTNYKKKPSKFHVGITNSGGSGVGPLKPTLLKCKKCKSKNVRYNVYGFHQCVECASICLIGVCNARKKTRL